MKRKCRETDQCIGNHQENKLKIMAPKWENTNYTHALLILSTMPPSFTFHLSSSPQLAWVCSLVEPDQYRKKPTWECMAEMKKKKKQDHWQSGIESFQKKTYCQAINHPALRLPSMFGSFTFKLYRRCSISLLPILPPCLIKRTKTKQNTRTTGTWGTVHASTQ